MLATEPVRMMEPPSLRSGKPFCTVNRAPFTLMLNSLSKCSSETLPKGTNSPTPALAKIISIRPFTLPTVSVETIQIGQFGDIALNTCYVAADCRQGLIEFLLTAPCDEDIGSFFGEELCCR